MNPKTKKIVIIVVLVLLVGLGGGAVYFFSQVEQANVNTNTNQTAINAAVNSTVGLNTNAETNSNIDAQPVGSISTNSPITVQGIAFIKGYKTPSESYGILTNDGFEIGFGKYDSMKETFRPYIGDQIEVTFANVCRTSEETCCRTLFTFCGTVDSFTSLEEQ